MQIVHMRSHMADSLAREPESDLADTDSSCALRRHLSRAVLGVLGVFRAGLSWGPARPLPSLYSPIHHAIHVASSFPAYKNHSTPAFIVAACARDLS